MGSVELATGVVFAAVGLIFSLVGLAMTLAAEDFEANEFRGGTWHEFAFLLLLFTVGWAAAARRKAGDSGILSPRADLLLGIILAAVTLIFGLVALIQMLSFELQFDDFFSTFDEVAWGNFGLHWALLTLAWMVLSRPLDRRSALAFAGLAGGLGVLFGFVGFILGATADFIDDYVHGQGWLVLGTLLAVLATAALLGVGRNSALAGRWDSAR